MRALLVLTALLLTTLAGCTEPPPEEAQDELVLDEELEATSTTGVIRGIVVDASVQPIAGAVVAVQGLDRETTVGANGGFGFDGLEPGAYFLGITKDGYQPQQASVDVVAGVAQPPLVRVQLLRDPTTSPFHEAFQFNGFVKCGLSYIALCGLGGESVGDSFGTTFELASMPEWINMEAVWEGSQPTGDNFQLRLGSTPASPANTCCTATGPSPQQAQANRTMIEQYGIGGENDLAGRMFVWEMEGTGIQQHTGVCVPVADITEWCHGPGAALDQSFELFVHAFYHYQPPQEWRFTDDPNVPRPVE